MNLQLSVVIPAYNNWWLTKRCLLALDALRATSSMSFETIVIDNASSDETQHGMREFEWVRYQREEINTNFAGGNNIGAKMARAPYVLFLNNDAIPVGDAFAPLVAAFSDERVAIAGARVLFEDGPVQASTMVVLTNEGWWTSYRNLPADLPDVLHSREVLGINGAAIAVDREWFHSAGGFDEGYINGSEDVDLYMRARESGRTIQYVAEAVFHHYESASPNRYDFDDQNQRRFHGKWHEQMRSIPKVERGEIGAIAIFRGETGDAASDFALEDLIVGLRQFGHPIVRGKIKPWSLLDRRFRESATLEWFCGEGDAKRKHPTVVVSSDGALAAFHTFGLEEISIPWLPCVLPDAAERCAVFFEAACPSLAVVNNSVAVPQLRALGASFGMTFEVVEVGDVLDLSKGRKAAALAVLSGLTDPCAYGNLALAHAGVPVVIADVKGVRNVYCDDTAVIVPPENLAERALQALAQPELLRGNAERMKADAMRRFSVRRAAMRFTDIARVARNGFERRV